MKKTLFAFLVVAAFSHAAFCADDAQFNALIQRGDAKAANNQLREALADFMEADKLRPNHADVLVRISQQTGDLIARAPSRSEARILADTSLASAQRAVSLSPNHAKAHLALAIAYGRMTDFTSNKTKIEYSKFIRDETLKSIQLDPGNDYAWHVLGRWHAGIAGLNPVLKFFAKLVYGALPNASNEEALRFLKKASELAPARILHHQQLAIVYTTLGRLDLAREEWRTVLKLKPADDEDRQAQAEAKKVLGI
jgi:tetratricopeptide (TPR) repeat protein